MSTPITDGGSAFPVAPIHWDGHNGMTLRDYFAALALAGLLADSNASSRSVYAKDAYDLADAMLAARDRKGGAA